MLAHNSLRTPPTLLGIGASFFLSAAQVGLLVGWCNTTSAIVRHAKVDIWVMARQTRS
jgi:putative ABC transport system permease protein